MSMTLHFAIEKLLRSEGRAMSTQEISTLLNANKWYEKKDGSEITAFQIHGRTRKYPAIFNREGQFISLVREKPLQVRIERSAKQTLLPSLPNKPKAVRHRDEEYVLDLCDKILGLKCSRKHKFDFLVGDYNSRGKAARLPVDGFYPSVNLAIEYRERQHTEPVGFFDKKNILTVSGVHRGEQRKIYDERRRNILPKNGITLVEISYSDFRYDRSKKIVRHPIEDEITLRKILSNHIDGLVLNKA